MIDTANLEDGFYWVRYAQRWVVAEKISSEVDHCWTLTDEQLAFFDDDFDEIDPRPIKREDVK